MRIARDEVKEMKQATVLVTVLVYVGFLAASFYPQSEATLTKALGPTPWGIPCLWFARILFVVLAAPLPLVLWHLCAVMSQWRELAKGFSRYSMLLWIANGARHEAHLRRSYWISLLGQVYFFLLLAAWIAYAAYRGF
jgi:hypothetical protein